MTAYYTVVQYIPDPITDERVNVGVLTYGDGRVRARFLSNWSRVAQFGKSSDLAFLNEAAGILAAASEDDIRVSAATWADVLQLTEPRGSLLSPDELLVNIAERFLRSKPAAVRAARSHFQAAADARRRVKEAVTLRLGKAAATHVVKSNVLATGKNASHALDVAVENGKLAGGVFALSFEIERALERDIRATAFSLEDVRQANPNLPLAVAALPPRDDTKDLFFFARDLFPKFDVQLYVEGEISAWVDSVAGSVDITH